MEEVLSRRVKRLIRENKPLADLVLIDGGKGQLSSAIRAYQQTIIELRSLVKMPAMLAFAKRTDTLYFEDGREISIPASSPALKLLKRIRDEAHRFAITYHKKLRGKTLFASELNGLKGIGEKRKIALIRYFGSLEKLKLATIEEITKVKLIGKSFAEKIYEYLHG